MARIMVVDDDEQVRNIFTQILQRDGHEVVVAVEGGIALEKFREKPADLVIMDMIMPGMDGLNAMVELSRECPGTRILAVSGGGAAIGPERYLSLAKDLGAAKILPKPVDRRQLLSAVHDILEAKTEKEPAQNQPTPEDPQNVE